MVGAIDYGCDVFTPAGIRTCFTEPQKTGGSR
jgi:hypothetical protein